MICILQMKCEILLKNQLKRNRSIVVITPLNKNELETFFDKKSQDVLKFFLFKAIFSQPELVEGQKKNPIQVPKEHIEQWMVQCLGADPVGSGSYPVDILNHERKYGADAKMLSWNGKIKSLSGETSLAQKFQDVGSLLDEDFKNKKFSKILTSWADLLKAKLNKVFEDHESIEDIYYFFVIREENNFHICGMKLDLDKIDSLEVEKSSSASIWIKNFIDSDLGNVKIYKAKKRMELRLYPYNWIKKRFVISFDYSEIQINENKELIGMNIAQLYEFSLGQFENLFKSIVGLPEDN